MDIKTGILVKLRDAEVYVSGQSLCESLGVSRTAVWKCINQLKEEGYEFDAVSNKGYRIVKYPDVITKEEIESLLAVERGRVKEDAGCAEEGCMVESGADESHVAESCMAESCMTESGVAGCGKEGCMDESDFAGYDKDSATVRNVTYFEETDSTNTRAKLAGEAGEPSGTLFVAESQTGGKGRRGRTWVSPAGSGIWMSLLLRPDIPPYNASMLTIVAVMALVRAFEECCDVDADMENADTSQKNNDDAVDALQKNDDGASENAKKDDNCAAEAVKRNNDDAVDALQKNNEGAAEKALACMIKWPNDIVMGDRKICGILTEMSAELEQINYVVIGIGINVNTTEFDESIRDMASSIYLQTGKHVKRSRIIAAFAKHFDRYYKEFLKTLDLSGIVDEYNEHLINAGREVQIIEPDSRSVATAIGIDKTGNLQVRYPDGETRWIASGEVSVRGLYGYV